VALPDVGDEIPVLMRHAPTDSVGDVEGGGPRLYHLSQHLQAAVVGNSQHVSNGWVEDIQSNRKGFRKKGLKNYTETKKFVFLNTKAAARPLSAASNDAMNALLASQGDRP
jgi:hypothetical protein